MVVKRKYFQTCKKPCEILYTSILISQQYADIEDMEQLSGGNFVMKHAPDVEKTKPSWHMK